MNRPDAADLEHRIEQLAGKSNPSRDEARAAVEGLIAALEEGKVRAAARDANGRWNAVQWVKRGILLGFRFGVLRDMSVPDNARREESGANAGFSFVDKDLFPPRAFDIQAGIRIVPGGSTVRRGAFLAKGVVCMPPMYVNVGAYVDSDTMIDSHALVGSCAQVGARAHISAAAQLGGVLEPINASPVVIEDDVLVGGNCGVYEGTVVRRKAVLAAGVILTRGTPVYDLVNESVIKGGAEPLEIPEGAVVVPGARAIFGGWGHKHGLSLQTPVIVKYRDEKTDLATALEGWLR